MSKTAAKDALTATDGLTVERRFTTPGIHPFDEVEWELRDAVIGDPENPAFEQLGVEFPAFWSQNATNIVAQKYFRGKMGSPERESSVKQMIDRVAGTIAGWGREGGYFASDEDADAFEAELRRIKSEPVAGPGQLAIDGSTTVPSDPQRSMGHSPSRQSRGGKRTAEETRRTHAARP
jgi:ribonucleoside-diphosphate reductase alpha chain